MVAAGTFLQGETGAAPRTFPVVIRPGAAAETPTAQLVPKKFIY